MCFDRVLVVCFALALICCFSMFQLDGEKPSSQYVGLQGDMGKFNQSVF